MNSIQTEVVNHRRGDELIEPLKSTSIVPFKFEDKQVRLVMIDGKPHAVGKDMCDVLGYADPTTAIRSHCRGVQILHPIADARNRIQQTRVLAEGDMFRLITHSTLPRAERFERLVFEEILPTVHKYGSYPAPVNVPALSTDPLDMVQFMLDAARAQNRRIANVEQVQTVQREDIADTKRDIEDLRGSILGRGLRDVLPAVPSGQESVEQACKRIGSDTGFSHRTISLMITRSKYRLKPSNQVSGKIPAPTPAEPKRTLPGQPFNVYFVREVNALFKCFIGECVRKTPYRVMHPFFRNPIKLNHGLAVGDLTAPDATGEFLDDNDDGRGPR